MKRFVLFFAISLLLTSICLGLKVSPGLFSTQNVPIGEVLDLGISLVVEVDGHGRAIIRKIGDEVEAPQCEGYRSLPNPSWFIVDAGETLQPGADNIIRSKLMTNFPANDELYNQHFVVRLFVTGESEGMFQPAIIPYYFIETPPMANPRVPPAGNLAVAPSVLEFDAKNTAYTIRIYNNTNTAQKISAEIRAPEQSSRRFPNPSPGFYPLNELSKISLSSRSIHLGAKASSEITVRWLDITLAKPQSEAILLLKSDSGNQTFVRIRKK